MSIPSNMNSKGTAAPSDATTAMGGSEPNDTAMEARSFQRPTRSQNSNAGDRENGMEGGTHMGPVNRRSTSHEKNKNRENDFFKFG